MATWKDIPGYEGVYQASYEGSIRRIGRNGNMKEMRTWYARTGKNGKYGKILVLDLSKDGKRTRYSVIGLIARTFLGPCPEGYAPQHINGVQGDNSVRNIAYIPLTELCRKIGKKVRRPVAKLDASGQVVEFYPSAEEAGRRNYLAPSTVLAYCNREHKRATVAPDGYRYEYDES